MAPRKKAGTNETKSDQAAAPKRAAARASGAAKKRKPAATAKKAKPAARKAAAPPPPVRLPRRAIFVDVENTSSETALVEVLDGLAIDRRANAIELFAVGNWRTVGQGSARRLASLGAQLVHSAPARGVRDWSDLWIAVAAGCWLGESAPGDVLEIVSNDRAFDAVGDAAAARGVVFRRVPHRHATAARQPTEEARPARTARGSRGSRGGRRRRRGGGERSAAAPASARPADQAPASTVVAAAPATTEPHGASREQMLAVIARLTDGDPKRRVNVDILEKALKAEGFSRPYGSPRLVTRLRALKEVEVDAHGRVRLVSPIPEQPAE